MDEINNEDINFLENPIQRLKEEQKYLSSLPSIDLLANISARIKAIKFLKNL